MVKEHHTMSEVLCALCTTRFSHIHFCNRLRNLLIAVFSYASREKACRRTIYLITREICSSPNFMVIIITRKGLCKSTVCEPYRCKSISMSSTVSLSYSSVGTTYYIDLVTSGLSHLKIRLLVLLMFFRLTIFSVSKEIY